MVRHVIVWTIKDEYSEEEKEQIKKGIKEGLEVLKGIIPGLLEIKVNTDPLPGSSGDAMLDSVFEDFDALNNYKDHPAHVAVATGKVRPFMKIRSSFDFLES